MLDRSRLNASGSFDYGTFECLLVCCAIVETIRTKGWERKLNVHRLKDVERERANLGGKAHGLR